MVVELLADAPEIAGGRVEPLPTEGSISALNIPHSSIVFEMHKIREIRAEFLGGMGIAGEEVNHADLLNFTRLKAFAFDQRFERRNAHDLVYCIERAEEGLDGTAQMFREALAGVHGEVLRDCLSILRNRFAVDDKFEGYRKDGPVAGALFELGEGDEAGPREARSLRQREVDSVIGQLLGRVASKAAWR